MNATQVQNILVLCLIVGFGVMEYASRRYQTTVRNSATGEDTKLELMMFLSAAVSIQELTNLGRK
jgi:hypothetical protein